MADTTPATTFDDAGARAEVVAAASKALDRAGFKVVSSGLQDCLAAEERGEAPTLTRGQIEKLFLSLA